MPKIEHCLYKAESQFTHNLTKMQEELQDVRLVFAGG